MADNKTESTLMTLRVPQNLRAEFSNACALEDRPQSRVLRELMQDYATTARIPREVRRAFSTACSIKAMTEAAVLGELMRDYIEHVLEETDHE